MTDNNDTENNVMQQPLSAKELVDWENPPSLEDLKEDLTSAKSDTDSHVTKVKKWLDNLKIEGDAKPKKIKGKSQVQPKVIRKQAEWRYAALSEPFLSTEDIFNVLPVTYEDTAAAEQNQLVINNQFNTKIAKVKFIDEYVRTAVDEGTVIVRIGWDYEEEVIKKTRATFDFIEDTSEGVQAMYEEMDALYGTDQFEQEVPRGMRLAYERGLADETLYIAQERDELEEYEEIRVVKNQPTLEICDYRHVHIDPTCKGDLDKANFIIYSFETSLSDLKKDGKYTNLDRINLDASSVLAQPDRSVDEGSFTFKDKARKKIVAYEYWGYYDIDGSGKVKPIVATWVENALIRLEENPFPDKKLPFVSAQYLPVRKSSYGEPDGELLEENQKIIGAVTRGAVDVMARSANGQMGSRKDALDIVNRRKFESGLDYEFNPNVDPKQAFYMHTYPEIPNSVALMLNLQNADAESLSGVKAFSGSQGINGAALGDSVGGIKSALDATAKRELGILRRLTEGVIQIGRKFISMNAEFLSEQEIIRVTNENFIPVRRDDLAGNFDLKLSISTAEADQQQAEELSFMLQTMGNTMDPKMSQMLLVNIAKLRKMPELAKQIEEYEPQPDPMAVAKAELEIELLKAQIENERAKAMENRANAHLDMSKANTEAAKADNLDSDTDIKNLDFVEQESGVKQERDLQKHGEQARSNVNLELVKAAIADKDSTDQISD